MPHIDQSGPEGKGTKTGRGLGECKNTFTIKEETLGQGMGKRRNSGGGLGLGKRLKSSKIINNSK